MKNLPVRWLGLRLRALGWAALAVGSARAAIRSLAFALEFVPRPDDLFVCSFPKSGTTLMQMILFQLTTDGDVERLPHMDAFSPWFELDLADSGAWCEALASPRIFKSHVRRRRRLPRQGKVIYLVRDVRDVAVSAYHHCALINGREIQLEPFVDRFLRGHPMFGGSWFHHVEAWWPHRDDPDVLFVEYGEMIADLEGTVRRVAAFCGLPISEPEMPRILARCGMAYMKAHDDKFDPRLHRTAPREQGFLGRGRPGAGRGELSPRQQALLNDRVAELARDLGSARGEPSMRWLHPEND